VAFFLNGAGINAHDIVWGTRGSRERGALSRWPTPFFLVGFDLLLTGAVMVIKLANLEVFGDFHHIVVEGYVVFEAFRDIVFIDDGLPWTFGLARCAINTLFRVYIELIGEFFFVVPLVFINTVDWTDRCACGVDAVLTQSGNNIGHFNS